MKNLINKISNVFFVLAGVSLLLWIFFLATGETFFEYYNLGLLIFGVPAFILGFIYEVVENRTPKLLITKGKGSKEVSLKIEKKDAEDWYVSFIETYEKVGEEKVKFRVYFTKEPGSKFIEDELLTVNNKIHLILKNKHYVCNWIEVSKVTDEDGETVFIDLIGVRTD